MAQTKVHDISKSLALWDDALHLIPNGVQLLSRRPERFAAGVSPIYVERGLGARFWDVDGNEYLDYLMGIGPVILGYCDPDVNRAVSEQLAKGTVFSINSPLEVELARLLVEVVPCGEMVRYCKGGGEADAIAIRIARAHTGRDVVLFCGYHGWSDWYIAANLADQSNLDGHLMPGLSPAGVPRALRGTVAPFVYGDLPSLAQQLEAHSGQVAAVIMEAARSEEPPPGYLQGVCDLAHRHGAVVIFDEVITGFRFAIGGAQELFGVTPDIATFGKALSNGVPLGAIVGRREVMQSLPRSFISSTYWSDALGFAAALATIKKLREQDVIGHIWKLGTALRDGLNAIGKELGVPLDVTGFAPVTHQMVHLPDPQISRQVFTLFLQEMAKRGVLMGGVSYISLAHTMADIDRTLALARQSLALCRRAIDSGDVTTYLEAGEYSPAFARLVR